MTISSRVTQELFEAAQDGSRRRLIRLPPTSTKEGGVVVASDAAPRGVVRTWTRAEHERFLRGLELFPKGPWKKVAEYVATKTTRQTMAHAQKYRQRIARQRSRLLLATAGGHALKASADNQSSERLADSDEDFDDDDDGEQDEDDEEEDQDEEDEDRGNQQHGHEQDAFFETEILPLLLPEPDAPLEPLPLSSFPVYPNSNPGANNTMYPLI
ncbi:hypothetical protein ATCC90586_000074 [Pythium insidiosum]|nr:hypothetical protein ATCC90586_000074 [Pythium insidiosum]